MTYYVLYSNCPKNATHTNQPKFATKGEKCIDVYLAEIKPSALYLFTMNMTKNLTSLVENAAVGLLKSQLNALIVTMIYLKAKKYIK